MSWWIHLRDPETKEPAEVEWFCEGGTYNVKGSTKAELNITYNYSRVTGEIGFHFKDTLDDRRAGDTIETLQYVVDRLGTETDDDYWAPTPGNAGAAANILLGWAKQYPDYVWEVF